MTLKLAIRMLALAAAMGAVGGPAVFVIMNLPTYLYAQLHGVYIALVGLVWLTGFAVVPAGLVGIGAGLANGVVIVGASAALGALRAPRLAYIVGVCATCVLFSIVGADVVQWRYTYQPEVWGPYTVGAALVAAPCCLPVALLYLRERAPG